jgi:hypothetical protein
MEVAKKVAQADSLLAAQRPMVKVNCWCVDETLEPSRECESCSGDGWHYATLYPHSLTAARLRLADAAEAWMKTGVVTSFAKFSQTMDAEWVARQEMLKARAALRTARGEG